MAVNHYFNVFSNDGSTTLFTSANTVNNSTIITVTETGLTIGTETYTYSGTKKFIGVSGLANSTSPGYAIGESFDGGEDSVYIVEEEPATSAVTVEYNGLVIATIPNGKMATVSCNGKKMTTDVIIEVPTTTDSPLPTEVSTEAEMTALLESGEVGGVYKYTGTTGTYENGALYVLENELITFTIDGTSYEAEDGMTWGEWCDSEYNTGGYAAHPNIGVGTEDSKVPAKNQYCITYNSSLVSFGDLIIANASYGLRYETGAGGAD